MPCAVPAPRSRFTRRWLACGVLATLLGAAAACAEGLTPPQLRALVRPADGPPPTGTEAASVPLRGRHSFVILPAPGLRPGVILRAVQTGSRDPVRYRAIRADGATVAQGSCPPGQEASVRLPLGSRCLFHVNAGRGAATVRVVDAYSGLQAGPEAPAHFQHVPTRRFFFVPRGTRAFTVGLRGTQAAPATVRVCTPSGQPAATRTTQGHSNEAIPVTVAPADAGQIWSLAIEGATGTDRYGELALWLGPEVPPFLAESPEALTLPFIHYTASGALYLGARGKPAMLEAAINVAPQGDRRIRAAMTRAGSRKALWATQPARFPTGRVRILLPETIAPGAYDLSTALLGEDGAVAGTHTQRIVVRRGFAYLGAEHPLLELLPPADAGSQSKTRLPRARLNVDAPSRSSLALHVALFRPGEPEPAFQETRSVPSGPECDVALPADAANGLYHLVVSLRGEADGVAAQARRTIYLHDGQVFTEAPAPPPMPRAPLRPPQRRRGYVLFAREYHDAFPAHYEPPRADIGRPLTVWATPGEFEPATFGVYTLKPLRDARVRVSPLQRTGGSATIPASCVSVRLARFWPQRTDWNSTTFRIIPELLEPASADDLPSGRVSQYWLTLHVPPGTPPGDYRGTVWLHPANAPASHLKFLVKVLPFTLARPANRTWGLFADSARWQTYSDAELEQELRDIRDHGIGALLISPLAHGTLRCEGDRLALDFAPLSRLMASCRRAGLPGPMILDVHGLASEIAAQRGGSPDDPETRRLALVVLTDLAVRAAAEGWPRPYFHVLDQSSIPSPESIARTQAALTALKQAGLALSATAVDPAQVPPQILPLVDAWCYSLGFVLDGKAPAASPAPNGKPFWWYGSGCYTFGTGEEGNVALNRYLTGVAFWRSGAAAQWSWTYQRPRGDPYTDFDGGPEGDAKDACLTYPARTPGVHASIPTIQWEGIREGIDDFAYLHTFHQMVERAKRSGNARAAAYAAQVEREAQRRLDAVPGGMAPTRLTAYDTHVLRKWLSKYMGTLVNKLKAGGSSS